MNKVQKVFSVIALAAIVGVLIVSADFAIKKRSGEIVKNNSKALALGEIDTFFNSTTTIAVQGIFGPNETLRGAGTMVVGSTGQQWEIQLSTSTALKIRSLIKQEFVGVVDEYYNSL